MVKAGIAKDVVPRAAWTFFAVGGNVYVRPRRCQRQEVRRRRQVRAALSEGPDPAGGCVLVETGRRQALSLVRTSNVVRNGTGPNGANPIYASIPPVPLRMRHPKKYGGSDGYISAVRRLGSAVAHRDDRPESATRLAQGPVRESDFVS